MLASILQPFHKQGAWEKYNSTGTSAPRWGPTLHSHSGDWQVLVRTDSDHQGDCTRVCFALHSVKLKAGLQQTSWLGVKNRQARNTAVIKTQIFALISIVGIANKDTTLNRAACGKFSRLWETAVTGHEGKCCNDTALCAFLLTFCF